MCLSIFWLISKLLYFWWLYLIPVWLNKIYCLDILLEKVIWLCVIHCKTTTITHKYRDKFIICTLMIFTKETSEQFIFVWGGCNKLNYILTQYCAKLPSLFFSGTTSLHVSTIKTPSANHALMCLSYDPPPWLYSMGGGFLLRMSLSKLMPKY